MISYKIQKCGSLTDFPLHSVHPNKKAIPRAFIILDVRDKTLLATCASKFDMYASEIANNIELTFEIPSDISNTELRSVFDKYLTTFEAIADTANLFFENGEYKAVFEQSTNKVIDMLRVVLKNFETQSKIHNNLQIFLKGKIQPPKNQSVDQFISEIHERNGKNGNFLSERLSCISEIESELISIWQQLPKRNKQVTEFLLLTKENLKVA